MITVYKDTINGEERDVHKKANHHLHTAAAIGVAVTLMSGICGAANAATVTITESGPFPTPAAGPCEIHFTGDGIGWVEEIVANKIGRYDPRTGAIMEIPVPTPLSVTGGEAIGADGGVWFTEVASNKIARLDPVTEAIVEFEIPVPGALGSLMLPTGVAASDAIEAGPDNAMWFTEIGNNAIGRIDLTTHVITSYPIPTLLAGPIIIHRGPGNTMIFPEATADKVGQIDVTTHRFTEYAVPTPLSVPQGVITAPDGSIWFTETVGGKIARIDPTTHMISEWSIAILTNLFLPRPGPLVIGSDGNFYIGEGNLDGGTNIGQFNPRTHVYTDFPIPTLLASPCDLNVQGNSIYFGELLGNKVGKLKISD
jgi:virginiamycin B lyase